MCMQKPCCSLAPDEQKSLASFCHHCTFLPHQLHNLALGGETAAPDEELKQATENCNETQNT